MHSVLAVVGERAIGAWNDELDGYKTVQLIHERNSAEFCELAGVCSSSGVWEKLCEILKSTHALFNKRYLTS